MFLMGNKGLIALIVIVVGFLSLPLIMSGGGAYTPEEVATKFLDAESAAEMKKLVTAQSWEASAEMFFSEDNFKESDSSGSEFTVYQASINGDESTVPIGGLDKGRGTLKSVLLRKEEEKWLVYGTEMTAEGLEITMNFENPEQMIDDLMVKAMEMIPAEMKAQMTDGMKQMMRKQIKKEFEKSLHSGGN